MNRAQGKTLFWGVTLILGSRTPGSLGSWPLPLPSALASLAGGGGVQGAVQRNGRH